MRGSIFGKMISMSTFGESHGKALGVILDGVPSGLSFCLKGLQADLEKRAPGRKAGTTSRNEPDEVEILSGIFEGKTLGTPIAVVVYNKNQRSQDYDKLKTDYRPGHADKTTMMKYGVRDHRGGGRSSGRETLARVIGGHFAGLILPQLKVQAAITKLGPFTSDFKEMRELGSYRFADPLKENEIEKYLIQLKEKGDSVGGYVDILINDCPVGLGEPSFDKLKADLAKGLLSIGAVTSFSFGRGEEFGNLMGSEVSSDPDSFGGIEGGISNGRPINLKVTFKPTSTVGEKAKSGRHDPCIMPRACIVLESMVKFVIADHYLRQRAYE